ncbi:hypothetical protein KAZ93_03815 [Patescibacteria group bacterium]|nr:hypothetical protein [Patescibacteria group bacterium]
MNDVETIDIRVKIIEPLLKIQETLDKNIKSLKVIIQKEGANDIRINTVNSIRTDILSIAFIFGSNHLATNTRFPEFYELMDIQSQDKKDARIHIQRIMNDYIRFSILVMVQFKIEHLFAVLLKTINKFPQNYSSFKDYAGLLRNITK